MSPTSALSLSPVLPPLAALTPFTPHMPIMPLMPLMPCPAPTADEPGLPRGCGWFESSHELVHGMRVIEHDGFDALSAELPLAWLLAPYC